MDFPDRYHRQQLLADFGEAGQAALRQSRVLLVGCGALGTVSAEALTRAGVGHLRIVDRDCVEPTNLQRQTLFDETDAAEAWPKAEAARRRLGRINTEVRLEAVVTDLTSGNARRLAEGVDLILDGTDNFQTRYLLNDLAVALGLPYVYGGAVGTGGLVWPVLPHSASGDRPWERAGAAGPCLRCVFETPPDPGAAATCDTAGVLGPAAAIVAQLQSAEALKILMGRWDRVSRQLQSVDPWRNRFRALHPADHRDACPCCGQRRFDFLDGAHVPTLSLCGRQAVQIAPTAHHADLDLAPLADRLCVHGPVRRNEFLIRATVHDAQGAYDLTVFRDGRVIVHGTDEPAVARTLVARYVGT